MQIFTSGLSFVSLNLFSAEQRGNIISAPTSHMRHNAAFPQSTLLALGLRDNLAALITELKAGMAALQEDFAVGIVLSNVFCSERFAAG